MLSVSLLALAACGQATPQDKGGTEAADRESRSAPGTAVERSDAPPTLLIIGTSLTAGYGLDNPDDAYPMVLQRMADSTGFKVRVVNAGLSGETSAGALRRVDWLMRERADMVVIETGANDGLRGLNVDSTRSNLRGIITRIRSELPEAKIALVQMEAPPNLGDEYTRRFRESFRIVAEEERVELFPFLLEGVAGVAKLNQGDGIHPNEEGARLVAQRLWPAVQGFLTPGTPAVR